FVEDELLHGLRSELPYRPRIPEVGIHSFTGQHSTASSIRTAHAFRTPRSPPQPARLVFDLPLHDLGPAPVGSTPAIAPSSQPEPARTLRDRRTARTN